MPIAEPQPAPRIDPGVHFRADDAALVRRMQMGDEGAFETIFKRHHAPLLAYCRHMLSSQHEGEDALQQAFIKAHQALLGGTAPRELRPWLYAIARNCCLSAITARRGWVGIGWEGIESLDRTPALEGLSDQVHQREDLRELVAGIGRLPEDQRSALLLAELDDLSHQAIATIVGCPVSRVKALVYQARSALIADRNALGTSCQDIREELSVAQGGELRRGPLRRHLKLCVGCRDFQLAVSAQRQSLAAVLPVLPSAGLAAAILGHGAAHAAGAASIGGAGAGGAGVGATATGATGIATTGTAAATTAVGAGAGGGTSVGALIGGGLITKLAVGGTVVALASAGAVAVHRHPTHAIPHRATRLQADLRSVASSGTAARRNAATEIASPSGPSSSLGPESSTALAGARSPASSAGSGPSTALSGIGGAEPLPSATVVHPPSPALSSIPGQPAGKTGQILNPRRHPNARANHRRAARHRRHLRRARRRRRHLRAAHRRALVRKALRRRHVAKPNPPRTPVTVGSAHRKVRAAPAPGPVGAPAGTTTTGGAHHGVSGPRHHPPAGSTGEGTGTGTASTGTGKTGSGTGAGKTGTGKAGGSGSGKAGGGIGSTPNKPKASGSEKSSTGTESTSGTGSATEQSPTATGKSTTTGSGEASGPSTKAHPKKHLVSEEQLPNF